MQFTYARPLVQAHSRPKCLSYLKNASGYAQFGERISIFLGFIGAINTVMVWFGLKVLDVGFIYSLFYGIRQLGIKYMYVVACHRGYVI